MPLLPQPKLSKINRRDSPARVATRYCQIDRGRIRGRVVCDKARNPFPGYLSIRRPCAPHRPLNISLHPVPVKRQPGRKLARHPRIGVCLPRARAARTTMALYRPVLPVQVRAIRRAQGGSPPSHTRLRGLPDGRLHSSDRREWSTWQRRVATGVSPTQIACSSPRKGGLSVVRGTPHPLGQG